jgi:hypothetical protein
MPRYSISDDFTIYFFLEQLQNYDYITYFNVDVASKYFSSKKFFEVTIDLDNSRYTMAKLTGMDDVIDDIISTFTDKGLLIRNSKGDVLYDNRKNF